MKMVTIEVVEAFLNEFKIKMSIWDILFANRDKNLRTLALLEISPTQRVKVLEGIEVYDYSQGPIEDNMIAGADLWVFGKVIKGKEVYIKITLGTLNLEVICISFHLSEYPMNYPIK